MIFDKFTSDEDEETKYIKKIRGSPSTLNDKAIDFLFGQLSRENDTEKRKLAAKALPEVAKENPTKTFENINAQRLLTYLDDPIADIRIDISFTFLQTEFLAHIIEQHSENFVIEPITQRLTDSNDQVRQNTITVLVEFSEYRPEVLLDVVAPVRSRLDDPVGGIRRDAVWILFQIADSHPNAVAEASTDVIKLYQDPAPVVRANVIEFYGNFVHQKAAIAKQAPDIVPRLQWLASDEAINMELRKKADRLANYLANVRVSTHDRRDTNKGRNDSNDRYYTDLPSGLGLAYITDFITVHDISIPNGRNYLRGSIKRTYQFKKHEMNLFTRSDVSTEKSWDAIDVGNGPPDGIRYAVDLAVDALNQELRVWIASSDWTIAVVEDHVDDHLANIPHKKLNDLMFDTLSDLFDAYHTSNTPGMMLQPDSEDDVGITDIKPAGNAERDVATPHHGQHVFDFENCVWNRIVDES